MKKIIPLIVITFLFASCEMKLKKTNEPDSLLDYGFSESSAAVLDVSDDTVGIFKSEASKHYGIDISHWQGNVLSTMTTTDSLRFIICKATTGSYGVDPEFRNNWHEIKEKGLIRGSYHFYMCSDDPVAQAEHFCTTISDISSDDIAPILDIEQGGMSSTVSSKQMVADVLVFLKAVEKKLNRKPLLYTDYGFAQEYLTDPEFANYDLWLAEYSGDQKPKVPDTWKEKGYKIWQKSSSYHIDSKKIDYDLYTGLLNEIVK